MQNCTTVNPTELKSNAVIFNHIEEILPVHQLPWTACYFTDTGLWGLKDRYGVRAVMCVDELGARQYETFVNEKFADVVEENI